MSELERMLQPGRPLCVADVIWILEYMKKKVVDEETVMLSLPQSHLLKSYQIFAQIALLLIHHRHNGLQDYGHLRHWIYELSQGQASEDQSFIHSK